MNINFEEFVNLKGDWCRRIFGPGLRTKGICEHIRKELLEIEREPESLEEWIDVIFLALDGAYRVNPSGDAIAAMMEHKLKKIQARQWPALGQSEDKPIEHVKYCGRCHCFYSGTHSCPDVV